MIEVKIYERFGELRVQENSLAPTSNARVSDCITIAAAVRRKYETLHCETFPGQLQECTAWRLHCGLHKTR